MARLDPQIRSDTTILLWQKGTQAYELFTQTGSDEDRAVLNKIVKCLAIMLDQTTANVAARIRERGSDADTAD